MINKHLEILIFKPLTLIFLILVNLVIKTSQRTFIGHILIIPSLLKSVIYLILFLLGKKKPAPIDLGDEIEPNRAQIIELPSSFLAPRQTDDTLNNNENAQSNTEEITQTETATVTDTNNENALSEPPRDFTDSQLTNEEAQSQRENRIRDIFQRSTQRRQNAAQERNRQQRETPRNVVTFRDLLSAMTSGRRRNVPNSRVVNFLIVTLQVVCHFSVIYAFLLLFLTHSFGLCFYSYLLYQLFVTICLMNAKTFFGLLFGFISLSMLVITESSGNFSGITDKPIPAIEKPTVLSYLPFFIINKFFDAALEVFKIKSYGSDCIYNIEMAILSLIYIFFGRETSKIDTKSISPYFLFSVDSFSDEETPQNTNESWFNSYLDSINWLKYSDLYLHIPDKSKIFILFCVLSIFFKFDIILTNVDELYTFFLLVLITSGIIIGFYIANFANIFCKNSFEKYNSLMLAGFVLLSVFFFLALVLFDRQTRITLKRDFDERENSDGDLLGGENQIDTIIGDFEGEIHVSEANENA